MLARYAVTKALPVRVRSILNKYDATMLLPGVSGVLRFGYQPDNYRESTGQTLAAADQQVGLVVDAARVPGPELVTNGGFDTDVSEWSPGAVGTSVTWSSGRMVVGSDSTGFRAGIQVITTVVDRTYQISGTKTGGTATAGKLRVFSGAAELVRFNYTSAASVTLGGVFVATTTSTTIQCFTDTANATSEWDNISVRELPGIHASQSTSGFQPVLRNTSGIQSWQFDGTDDRLSLSAVPFQMADDHFVVAGGVQSLPNSSSRPLFTCPGTTARVCSVHLFGGVAQAVWVDDAGTQRTAVGVAVSPGTPFVLTGVKRGATDKILRQDGVQRDNNTLAIGAATATGAEIGARSAGSLFFSGNIHGVIFGKGAISDSELLTLERFMATLQGRQL